MSVAPGGGGGGHETSWTVADDVPGVLRSSSARADSSRPAWRLWKRRVRVYMLVAFICQGPVLAKAEDVLRTADPGTNPYEPLHFSLTEPYRLDGRHKREIQPASPEAVHPDRVQYVVRVGDKDLILNLERNRDLLPAHLITTYTGRAPSFTNVTAHCYYHGDIEGESGSTASVSTCYGLRGHFSVGDVSYGVEPWGGAGVAGERVGSLHRVFRLTDTFHASNSSSSACGVVHPLEPTLHRDPALEPLRGQQQQLHIRVRRAVLPGTRYVELLLVVDNTLFTNRYKGNKTAMVHDMAELTNIMDSFYKSINVRVVLVAVNVLTIDEENLIMATKAAGAVLGKFVKWRESNLRTLPRHDVAHLMSNGFTGALGMAFVGTICSRSTSGGVNSLGSRSIVVMASVTAHELGHNLGMGHDNGRSCSCPKSSCIMVGSLPSPVPTNFSSCSTDDFEDLVVQRKGGKCLLNVPKADEAFRPPVCGDKMLDAGEECDCGSPEECDNKCCDARTCRLRSGARCAYGSCCKDCQFVGQGEVCRAAQGVCDLPEFCSGSAASCPDDSFLQNGHPCQNAAAYCYNGVCQTYTSQCEGIWGPGAVPASDHCFTIVNMKGNEFGNCGMNAAGTPVSCQSRNVKCGKLICTNTPNEPLIGHIPNYVSYEGCRAVDYNYGPDVPDPGLVQPGTSCGSGLVCYDQKCQSDTILGYDCNTTTKCNGRGVCNNHKHCHCSMDWAPPDCSSKGCGGSIDSGPTCKADKSQLLWLLLLLVPVLAVVAFLGRRQYIRRKYMKRRQECSSDNTKATPKGESKFRPSSQFMESSQDNDYNGKASDPSSTNIPKRPLIPPQASAPKTSATQSQVHFTNGSEVSTIVPTRPPPSVPMYSKQGTSKATGQEEPQQQWHTKPQYLAEQDAWQINKEAMAGSRDDISGGHGARVSSKPALLPKPGNLTPLV
ncbi:disintegrin and metalloproteinase domain-containing protein 9-like [Petromyzon marinus]